MTTVVPRTDAEIVRDADQLAVRLAEEVLGYEFIGQGTAIREMLDPRLVMCWRMACCAIDELQQTNVMDALATVEGDREADRERMIAGAQF